MKVLLLGEYSGFYKNLAIGLKEFGVEVTWYCNGDSFKKISGNTGKLLSESRNFIIRNIQNFSFRKLLQDYDIVSMIDLRIWGVVLSVPMVNYIIKNNAKVYANMAGDCSFYYDSWLKSSVPYSPFLDNPQLASVFDGRSLASKLLRKTELYNASRVDGLIPVMNEYRIGVKNYSNLKSTIPLPVDTKTIKYKPNKIRDKIVIFHGLNRENSKGTSYIREAMNIIKARYPDDVEIIIDGNMPLDKYLKVIEKANIIIDQCKAMGWGMNACYSMAQGKIVLAGASKETLDDFGLKKCPIRHIKPDVKSIVEELENLVRNRNMIEQYGEESRKFVEEFHDSRKVAKQYLECWKN